MECFFLIENFWTINYFWNYASRIPKVLKCSNFKKNIIFPWGKSSFRSLSSCINLDIACPQLWPGISHDHLSWCSYLSPAYHGAWFYCFLVYWLILQDESEILCSANAYIQLSHLTHSKSFALLSSDCNVLGYVWWLCLFDPLSIPPSLIMMVAEWPCLSILTAHVFSSGKLSSFNFLGNSSSCFFFSFLLSLSLSFSGTPNLQFEYPWQVLFFFFFFKQSFL